MTNANFILVRKSGIRKSAPKGLLGEESVLKAWIDYPEYAGSCGDPAKTLGSERLVL